MSLFPRFRIIRVNHSGNPCHWQLQVPVPHFLAQRLWQCRKRHRRRQRAGSPTAEERTVNRYEARTVTNALKAKGYKCWFEHYEGA